jgi:hypothetical protein
MNSAFTGADNPMREDSLAPQPYGGFPVFPAALLRLDPPQPGTARDLGHTADR